MFHAVPTTRDPAGSAPPRPSLEAMSAAARMAEVMRRNARQGRPTTRDDFHAAEETYELSDTQLDLHIGPAKRLLHAEIVRIDQPPAPLRPWEADPDYREERIALASRLTAAALARAHFTPGEIEALGPDITAATLARLTREVQ